MILDRLEEHGLVENTLVVLSSDNGGEAGQTTFHYSTTSEHSGKVASVFLVLCGGRIGSSQRRIESASHYDGSHGDIPSRSWAIPPTDYQLDGMDLMPVLSQQASQTDRTFYWRVNRSNYRMRAIRHGDWKYIDDAGTMDLLFDLKNDISERKIFVIKILRKSKN